MMTDLLAVMTDWPECCSLFIHSWLNCRCNERALGQTDRQTDRKTDRQTEKVTETEFLLQSTVYQSEA